MIQDTQTHVVLSFDIDGQTLWTSRDKINRIGPVLLSQGRYGPEVGLPRILDLLRDQGVEATFFVTGQVADAYPDRCRRILDEGHEIGLHNYAHEWPIKVTPEVERLDFEKGLQTLTRLTGRQPIGYRAPAWEFSDITFELMLEHGIRYSSNMMDDERPYLHALQDRSTGIVELPCSWLLDDAAFFMHGLTYSPPQEAPSMVLEQWRAEFEGMHKEGDGRIYVLTMHPQIIGRSSRMAMLAELIGHIKNRPEAEIIRADKLVDRLNQSGKLSLKEFVPGVGPA